jgi:AcrR family transcriptional regulator
LKAAFQLIAERGVDGVAINEITEAADVGFGSFYNHFASKEAIHTAVLDAIFDAFGNALDLVTVGREDQAEIIAINVRHTISYAAREPLWARLLLREWYRPEAFARGLGARLLRDIGKGIQSQRFNVRDLLITTVVAGGTVMAAVAVQASSSGEGAKLLEHLGLSAQNLDQRAAAALLEGLGLSPREANLIAKRALPPFEWAPAFMGSGDEPKDG